MTQGKRPDQREYSENVAVRAFLLIAVLIVIAVLAANCAGQTPAPTGLLDIPRVQPIEPRPEWRTWVDQMVACVGKRPPIPYDSIAWFLAPMGIPASFAAGVPSGTCVSDLAYVTLKAAALSSFCAGGAPRAVQHAAAHVMYRSELQVFRRGLAIVYRHDPAIFPARCGIDEPDHIF